MRKFVFFLLFCAVGLSYLFKVDELIVSKFSFFNDIKVAYINKILYFSSLTEKYFEQANTIEKMRIENNELKEYKTLYTKTQTQLDNLKEFISTSNPQDTNLQLNLAKVLSYINYNDFTKVWLDQKKDDDTILGLITENYAAGIVVENNGQSMALLNGNKECSYAVFIGTEKIPGIVTSSKNGKDLLVKYIPIWSEIKVGDEVITSGMDNIFFEGLKVGLVEEITSLPDMKIAIVKPYANVLKKKYFFTYKHNPLIKTETQNVIENLKEAEKVKEEEENSTNN